MHPIKNTREANIRMLVVKIPHILIDRVNDLDFQIPFKAGNSHAALLYGK